MKKVLSIVLALLMMTTLMVGLLGCSKTETETVPDESGEVVDEAPVDGAVKLVSDTVNGITIDVPDDLSEFADTNGIMRAKNDASTASIAITAVNDAGGTTPETFADEETFSSTQMATFTDVQFLEFNNKASLDGVPTVFAHTKGLNSAGVMLEIYTYIIFFEDGSFQSVVILFSEGSNTSLQENIQAVTASIKLAK